MMNDEYMYMMCTGMSDLENHRRKQVHLHMYRNEFSPFHITMTADFMHRLKDYFLTKFICVRHFKTELQIPHIVSILF